MPYLDFLEKKPEEPMNIPSVTRSEYKTQSLRKSLNKNIIKIILGVITGVLVAVIVCYLNKYGFLNAIK